MNIFTHIDDHHRQRELLDAIKATRGDSTERRTLYEQFSTELRSQASAEKHKSGEPS